MKNSLDRSFNAGELKEASKKVGLEYDSSITKDALMELIIEKDLVDEVLAVKEDIPIVEVDEDIKEENAEEKEVKEDKKDKGRLIYCGPSIGFKASKNSAYIGGIPKILDDDVKECKAIEKLFVEIKDFARTKKNIETDGTAENIYYKQVEEYLLKKGSDE